MYLEVWGFPRFWHSGPPAGGPHDGLLVNLTKASDSTKNNRTKKK